MIFWKKSDNKTYVIHQSTSCVYDSAVLKIDSLRTRSAVFRNAVVEIHRAEIGEITLCGTCQVDIQQMESSYTLKLDRVTQGCQLKINGEWIDIFV